MNWATLSKPFMPHTQTAKQNAVLITVGSDGNAFELSSNFEVAASVHMVTIPHIVM